MTKKSLDKASQTRVTICQAFQPWWQMTTRGWKVMPTVLSWKPLHVKHCMNLTRNSPSSQCNWW